MTSALPPALDPWRPWLAWFAPDIAAMLGDLLLRLDPMLGRGGQQALRGQAEPDGIDDLRQRGPYERLLLSEWALADAAPEEFLRRAANNEHLFLAPRLVTRRTDALIAAVFDTGPAQWGAPRLVHVALWILLARRAQAAQARFAWGVAHAPGVLHDAASPAKLMQLMHARTHDVATAEHWQAWQAFPGVQSGGERWCLSAVAGDVDGFTHAVRVRRGFDEQLHVDIGTRQARRRVALALPPARQAERLLRGDFTADAPPPALHRAKGRFSLRQPPLISFGGEHVALPMTGESKAAVFRMPAKGQRKQVTPRYGEWQSGSELLCGVLSGKDMGGVIADAFHLHFWKLPGFQAAARPPLDAFAVTPGLGRWLRAVWLNNGGRTHRLLILDDAGHLLSITNAQRSRERADAAHAVVGTGVLALTHVDAHRALFAEQSPGHVHLRTIHREGTIAEVAAFPVTGTADAVLVAGRFRRGELTGAACIGTGGPRRGRRPVHWTLHQHARDGASAARTLTLATGWKAVGLVPDAISQDGYVLLALRADRRALVAIGPHGLEVVHASGEDIATVSVSPDGERVAFVDMSGQLVVLGDGGRTVVMRARGSVDD